MVNCQRVFSKLKIIKNRLWALLSNDHAFLLMSLEKEILNDFKYLILYLNNYRTNNYINIRFNLSYCYLVLLIYTYVLIYFIFFL